MVIVKRILIIIICLYILLLPEDATAISTYWAPTYGSQIQRNLSFKDLREHWSQASVLRMVSLGILKGYEDGNFKPNDAVTQEEVVTMLVRFTGLESEVDNNRETALWYLPYLQTALKFEYITQKEYAAIIKVPDQPATREQAVIWLALALGLEPKLDTNIQSIYNFKDWGHISPGNLGYIESMVREGLISGVSKYEFGAIKNVTRAQMAVLLDRSAGFVSDRRGEQWLNGIVIDRETINISDDYGSMQETEWKVLIDNGDMVSLRTQKKESGEGIRDFPEFINCL
mgnify:CR=1 FL=1